MYGFVLKMMGMFVEVSVVVMVVGMEFFFSNMGFVRDCRVGRRFFLGCSVMFLLR